MLKSSQLKVLEEDFVNTSWVNPLGGFNRGYRLDPSFSRPLVRSTRVYGVYVTMPSSAELSIYMLPVKSISWIGDTNSINEWTSVFDYCNATGTIFTIINPKTGLSLDIRKCYISLVNGVHPILAVPYVPFGIDVNIALSRPPYEYTATKFELTGNVGEDTSAIDAKIGVSTLVYIDGMYYSAKSVSDLPRVCDGYLVDNIGFKYVVTAKIPGLDTYLHNSNSYFIVDLATDDDTVYHYTNAEFHLINGDTGIGVTIDKTDWDRNIHQLTNHAYGIRAEYIENLAEHVGIPLESASIEMQIMASAKTYLDNTGYDKSLEKLEFISPSRLMSNGDHRLAFLYGATLADNKSNALQLLSIPNIDVTSDIFEQHVIDNRLMSRRSDFEDSRVTKVALSGGVSNRYSAQIKYSKSQVDISNYILPRIYKADHTVGAFGAEYYVGDGNILTLLKEAYIVDHNGKYQTVLGRPYQLTDLSAIPLINHPNMTMELSANDIYLHKDIDYTLLGDQIIVWKAGVTEVDIVFYFSTYKRSRVTWVTDDVVYIPKTDVYAMAPRISVYCGESQLEPAHRMPAKNGLPVTVEYELLDLFNTSYDVDTVKPIRDEYDTNVNTILDYYTRYENDGIVTGFTDFYFLVSPFCMEVLASIRAGDISPSMNNIFDLGLRGCIPDDILARYDLGYDPSVGNNVDGEQFVIIKAHDEEGIIEVTRDEWNFLRHVNAEMLRGRITLELYYRIIYE